MREAAWVGTGTREGWGSTTARAMTRGRKRASRRSSTCWSRLGSSSWWWPWARSCAWGRTGGSRAWLALRHRTRLGLRRETPCSTSSCTRGAAREARGRGTGTLPGWQDEQGQATVEAALLLPVLMVLMALLVQPACLLYTRCVMQSAAAEGCRLVATSTRAAGAAPQAQCAYVLRRLAAVPDAPIFHEGGEAGWEIELSGSTSAHAASARITTTARPLPFVGVLAGMMGQGDGSGGRGARGEREPCDEAGVAGGRIR